MNLDVSEVTFMRHVMAGIIMMVIIVIILIIIAVLIVHLQEQVVVLGTHSATSKHALPPPSKYVTVSGDFRFLGKKHESSY